MPLLSYPGVYIQEIPSGARTITGVATSITAFIGRCKKGESNEPVTINSYSDFERQFGGLWSLSRLGYAVKDFYQNGGSQAIVVRVRNGGAPATLTLQAEDNNSTLTLEAANAGEWGNNLSTTVDHETKDNADTLLFNLLIEDSDSGAKETFLNVSVDEDSARFIGTILEQQSQLARVSKDNADAWLLSDIRPGEATVQATADSGTDGDPLTADQFNGAGLSAAKEGLYALEKADLFNILCIPPYLDDESVDTAVITDAAVYCEERRAFYIIDPPPSWSSKANALTELPNLGTTSKNAAVFFPRIRKPDPLKDNQLVEFAPCGVVAGIFARTDSQRGVWKAPAGQEASLVGVSALTIPLTDSENGELNPQGINCLRNLPAVGRVLWGARTLQGKDALASEWKYTPVRRIALFIEETLYRSSKWIVFEPNDEALWSQIRMNIGAFMHSLFLKEAFQGSSPADAYFVKCDSETTTQNDIDNGIVNISVGFAPLKPAEFVVISIQQIAGQSNI